MIKVSAKRNSVGLIYRLQAEGHAGYDDVGKDIICAAVTAIIATALVSLTDILHKKPQYLLNEGELLIDMSGQDYEAAEVQLILESALLGLRQVSASYDYGKYIAVE